MSLVELENILNGKDVRENLISIKNMLVDKANIELIKKDDNYSVALFNSLLVNDDPKVRKNAALIMGQLSDEAFADCIYQGYLLENTMFVKSSYLKALRNYDTTPFLDTLKKRKAILENSDFEDNELKHVSEELAELKKILPNENVHEKHVFVNPTEPVFTILTCKKEMCEPLIKAVDDIVGRKTASKVFCGVAVKSKDIGKLAAIRFYKDMLFPVNGLKASEKENLIKDILSGDLIKLLNPLHEESDEPYYFRIASGSLDTQKIGRELETASKGKLINSVSDYEIEIRLLTGKEGKIGILLKLFTRKDKRFVYRKNSIATSLHPVNAAAIVKLAYPYMEKHAQVLDPFCGVGTLLIERHKAMPAKYLYGTDIYGAAITAARENGELAKTEINFIQKDFFDFKHDYLFDEIITEMPKLSKEENDEFYKKFLEKCSELLKKDGIMIVASDEMGVLKKQLRLHKEYELLAENNFDTKENVKVYIIKKKSGDRAW